MQETQHTQQTATRTPQNLTMSDFGHAIGVILEIPGGAKLFWRTPVHMFYVTIIEERRWLLYTVGCLMPVKRCKKALDRDELKIALLLT